MSVPSNKLATTGLLGGHPAGGARLADATPIEDWAAGGTSARRCGRSVPASTGTSAPQCGTRPAVTPRFLREHRMTVPADDDDPTAGGPVGKPSDGGAGGLQRQRAADLLPLVYKQLRDLARHRIRQENPAHTLQATALVHEAYLRVTGGDGFANRAHFFRAAAEAMRRILIDHARAKGAAKRGGRRAVELTSNLLDLATVPDPNQILALDEAISRLEKESPTAAAVVRLRFYAGLSVDETAETLDVSPRSVNREWTYARAWLYRLLERDA